MQDQTTSPEESPVMEPYTSAPKPKRITLTRIEAFAVMEYLKKESELATTPIEKIVQLVKLGTDIETTHGIITRMLKDMSVPHISFRSTPKPGAIDLAALALRIDCIDSRLEFVTGVVTAITNRVRAIEESLAVIGQRIDMQGGRITDMSNDIRKIDRELESVSK